MNIRPLTEKEQLEFLVQFLKSQRDYYESELEQVNEKLDILNGVKKLHLEKRRKL